MSSKDRPPRRHGGTAIANPKLAEEGTLAQINFNIKKVFLFEVTIEGQSLVEFRMEETELRDGNTIGEAKSEAHGAGRLVADSGYPYESSRVYYIREVLRARTVF